MIEKLKVSREVADAIESFRSEFGDEKLLWRHAQGWADHEPLCRLPMVDLATALIVGYEVEMAPHEYVTKHYNIAKRNKKESLEKGDIESAMLNRGVMVGIKRTLRAFQITVEGVNDNDN